MTLVTDESGDSGDGAGFGGACAGGRYRSQGWSNCARWYPFIVMAPTRIVLDFTS